MQYTVDYFKLFFSVALNFLSQMNRMKGDTREIESGVIMQEQGCQDRRWCKAKTMNQPFLGNTILETHAQIEQLEPEPRWVI